MRPTRQLLALAVASALAAGCTTTPEQVAELEEARQAVADVRQNPEAARYARAEVKQAEDALAQANRAFEQGEDLEIIVHEAHMAHSHAEIAAARIGESVARANISDAELERTRVLEEVRTQQAQAARQDAEEARMQADMASERADALQQELADLKAEETERGIVLTLGDVLFDTGEAQLKPGANATIQRLSQFLNEYPDRRLLIEGHTDSRGSDEFNQDLSQRRADAVRTALLQAGVPSERVRAQGLGEQFPVASNDTNAGRQENRRVEIIVATEGESDFPESLDSSARNQ
jgi:outer membrane protein OmpA-like peptidoglycan-associated protein